MGGIGNDREIDTERRNNKVLSGKVTHNLKLFVSNGPDGVVMKTLMSRGFQWTYIL